MPIRRSDKTYVEAPPAPGSKKGTPPLKLPDADADYQKARKYAFAMYQQLVQMHDTAGARRMLAVLSKIEQDHIQGDNK